MAATDDMIEGGDYIGPKRMGEMRHSAQKVQVVEASKNKEDGARLWDLSEQLTGVKFLSNYNNTELENCSIKSAL